MLYQYKKKSPDPAQGTRRLTLALERHTYKFFSPREVSVSIPMENIAAGDTQKPDWILITDMSIRRNDRSIVFDLANDLPKHLIDPMGAVMELSQFRPPLRRVELVINGVNVPNAKNSYTGIDWESARNFDESFNFSPLQLTFTFGVNHRYQPYNVCEYALKTDSYEHTYPEDALKKTRMRDFFLRGADIAANKLTGGKMDLATGMRFLSAMDAVIPVLQNTSVM